MEISLNLLFIFLGICVGVFITILSEIIKYLLNRNLTQKEQLGLLTGELIDFVRHSTSNYEILNTIDLSKGIPVDFHFKKLKVDENSIIFSQNTHQSIHNRFANYVSRFRTEIRNLNIEIDEILSMINEKDCNQKLLAEYIEHLKDKILVITIELPKKLGKLVDNPNSLTYYIDKAKNEGKEGKRLIIYRSQIKS